MVFDDSDEQPETLFEIVKSPYKFKVNNTRAKGSQDQHSTPGATSSAAACSPPASSITSTASPPSHDKKTRISFSGIPGDIPEDSPSIPVRFRRGLSTNTLFDGGDETLRPKSNNSVIAFHDNASALRGARGAYRFRCGACRLACASSSANLGIGVLANGGSSFCAKHTARHLFPKPSTSASTYGPCLFERTPRDLDVCLTAETHNFPTGIAPFPGAATGTGGRVRDSHSAGRGSIVVAASAGYCVGRLGLSHRPGVAVAGNSVSARGRSEIVSPWEESTANGTTDYCPDNMASPMKILIEASNGASDYGNKFGEPVLVGFCRSFGLRLDGKPGTTNGVGSRVEWLKPIMFSSGLGFIDHSHTTKYDPTPGDLVVKLGGPAYRVGIGGGSASSAVPQSTPTGDASQGYDANRLAKSVQLDFNAVQRGDAEMGNKLNRVVRCCVEMGPNNPIRSIHDQGCGGSGNVIKEITSPAGCVVDIRAFPVGDPTMSVMELWGAEYQENDVVLVRGTHEDDHESIEVMKWREALGLLDRAEVSSTGELAPIAILKRICRRERLPVAIVGVVTGDGIVTVYDKKADSESKVPKGEINIMEAHKDVDIIPLSLPLSAVLENIPQKTYYDETPKEEMEIARLYTTPGSQSSRHPIGDRSIGDCLFKVVKLLAVGSKRFLTTKVDRCVGGLAASQQCVGPLGLPVGNVGVIAEDHRSLVGAATAIGEQPLKGLINPARMARLSVAEALTNLVWAPITALSDVRCSGNWMWPAKYPGEAIRMYNAATWCSEFMIEVGVAIDGGKDSLSMAATAPYTIITGESTNANNDIRQTPCTSEVVKCPPSLTISAYAGCCDVSNVVTPDLKLGSDGRLILVDLGAMGIGTRYDMGRLNMTKSPSVMLRTIDSGSVRASCVLSQSHATLGGSSLSYVMGTMGRDVAVGDCPDVCEGSQFKSAFRAIQKLMRMGLITAGHDRSDGGLITTVLEMSMAGDTGVTITAPPLHTSGVLSNLQDRVRDKKENNREEGEDDGDKKLNVHGCDINEIVPLETLEWLFNEAPGLVFEVHMRNVKRVLNLLKNNEVANCSVIGECKMGSDRFKVILCECDRDDLQQCVFDAPLSHLNALWEATSFGIERQQCNPKCVDSEQALLLRRQWGGEMKKQLPRMSVTVTSAGMSLRPGQSFVFGGAAIDESIDALYGDDSDEDEDTWKTEAVTRQVASTALSGGQGMFVSRDWWRDVADEFTGQPNYGSESIWSERNTGIPRMVEKRWAVAVVREEGSNGDREMGAAFDLAGFEVWDVTMTDLLADRISLDDFRGIAFVGGFSYSDVLDSAKGWASVIGLPDTSPVQQKGHETRSQWTKLQKKFRKFYFRQDTFSIGLCNGCQLMALLGWVPGLEYLTRKIQNDDGVLSSVRDDECGSVMSWPRVMGQPMHQYMREDLPRFVHNESGRFECRFPTIAIPPLTIGENTDSLQSESTTRSSPEQRQRLHYTNAMMLEGMAGWRLGCWSSHGEGRAHFPNKNLLNTMIKAGQVAACYANHDGEATTRYPFNPNGSEMGIAALCSQDGRHLAMMTHPERSFLFWQWPHVQHQLRTSTTATVASAAKRGGLVQYNGDIDMKQLVSPWIKMFTTARLWCDRTAAPSVMSIHHSHLPPSLINSLTCCTASTQPSPLVTQVNPNGQPSQTKCAGKPLTPAAAVNVAKMPFTVPSLPSDLNLDSSYIRKFTRTVEPHEHAYVLVKHITDKQAKEQYKRHSETGEDLKPDTSTASGESSFSERLRKQKYQPPSPDSSHSSMSGTPQSTDSPHLVSDTLPPPTDEFLFEVSDGIRELSAGDETNEPRGIDFWRHPWMTVYR
eukprot:GHVN01074146.1.p1 GENE.GHVN01074146.1~~GHVN01074146.1.p1  ORF type:complete len:2085 (-),score=365.76 GHVN01074146.1:861-6374(-)